jgi:hypothetical protein
LTHVSGGVAALAEALRACPLLTSLHLSNTKLGCRGALTLRGISFSLFLSISFFF